MYDMLGFGHQQTAAYQCKQAGGVVVGSNKRQTSDG